MTNPWTSPLKAAVGMLYMVLKKYHVEVEKGSDLG